MSTAQGFQSFVYSLSTLRLQRTNTTTRRIMFPFTRCSGSGNRRFIAAVFAILLSGASTPVFAKISCADLMHAQIPDVRIDTAEEIHPAPVWKFSGDALGGLGAAEVRVPFCRVSGVMEKEIAFELWLPDDWNQRYLGLGNGGDAGFINYSSMAYGVGRGFASASSNLGHWRSDPHWALGHPDRLENYEWRAHHLMAVNSKKLIALYYGSPAHHAYYEGCSGGGMGGMNEVQRFPADYDGVIAGASGTSFAGIAARWVLDKVLTQQDPASELKPDDWKRIAETAIQQCDALDGVKDGIIINPAACKFDIASTPGLTPAQVRHAKAILGPLVGKDGRTYFPALSPGALYSSFPEHRRLHTRAQLRRLDLPGSELESRQLRRCPRRLRGRGHRSGCAHMEYGSGALRTPEPQVDHLHRGRGPDCSHPGQHRLLQRGGGSTGQTGNRQLLPSFRRARHGPLRRGDGTDRLRTAVPQRRIAPPGRGTRCACGDHGMGGRRASAQPVHCFTVRGGQGDRHTADLRLSDAPAL